MTTFEELPIPEESSETTLARIEAAASLLDSTCPHCHESITAVIAQVGELPRTVSVAHLKGCPDFLPE